MADRGEFVSGLSASREYLLSHHPRSERHRCYAPELLGRRVHLCARCSGVYPGIALGVVAASLGPSFLASLTLVTFLPMFALLDWAFSAFTSRRGSNLRRTGTGAGLGYAYGVGLVMLFVEGHLAVLAVGVAYGTAAFGLLSLERMR